MEYSFRLSELFPEEITVIGNNLLPVGCPNLKQIGEKVVRERVTEILDTMGRASAEAQALHAIITSADKLRQGDNKLYLFCDFSSNKVVGLLKIGKKKLFLFDDSGVQHELQPLCILDFYIHESRQRHGAGKYLFDYMLREEAIPVEHFAIDRPSDKLIFFLRKHYNLTKVLPQVNNFCLFDGFFLNRADYQGKKKRWAGLDQTPDVVHQVAYPKKKESRMEDSLDYNHHEPLIHLRNGGQLPADYMQRRHVSSIGDIVQPSQQHHQNGNEYTYQGHPYGNGNGHSQETHNFLLLPASANYSRSMSIDRDRKEDLEYDERRHQARRLSRLTSLSPADFEIYYGMSVDHMDSAQFRKLRETRSRSHEVDQGHESLW